MQPNANVDQPRKPNGQFASSYEDRTLSVGEPAEPLLKVLPIKRLIPQDVHSMMDYVDGLTAATGFFMAENDDDDAACWASLALGASVIGVSLLSDYRLSLAKVIPIRAHETLDYVWGASCIAAPFVLGYHKSSPRVALTHIMVGAGTILASLFTDYRSYKAEKQLRKARKNAGTRSQADIEV
jgi:hypothetical protein